MLLKVLIIVFSRTGTSSKVANYIKEVTGGDIFNVTSLVDYSGVSGYLKGCYHQLAGTIPDIKEVPGVDDYDFIYIGGPTWAWKPAGPILKVLEEVDFKNKKVAPFLVSQGNYGSYFEKFKDAAKNADIVSEGAFKGAERMKESELKELVVKWATKLTKPEPAKEKQKEL